MHLHIVHGYFSERTALVSRNKDFLAWKTQNIYCLSGPLCKEVANF